MTANTFWGQAPEVLTVSASPAPTSTVFTVSSATNLRDDQWIEVQVGGSGNYERTQITNIATNALTVSPALSTAPDQPGAVLNSRELTVKSRLNNGSVFNAATVAELKAVDTTYAPNGLKYLIDSTALYKLDTGSSATGDDYLVIDPTTGPGRWLLQIGSGSATTVTSDTAMSNGGSYIVGGSTRRTMTLPASPAVGPVNEVVAEGTGGYSVALNSGQTLRYQGTSYAYGYLLRNSDAYAAVRIRCTNTNQFTVIGHEGAITFGALGAGYIGGGNTGSPINTISKLAYLTETRTTLAATLGNNRDFQGGSVGVSGTAKGYYVGQYTGAAAATTIDDLDFSDDSSDTIAAVLSTARYACGTGASTTHGYILGGHTGAAYSTLIEKIDLSTDGISTVTDTLDVGKAHVGSVQSSTKIYLLAGDKSGEVPSDDVEEFVLATETSTLLGATMPAAIYFTCAAHSSTAGYLMGGDNGGAVATIRKFTFSSETSSTPSATLDTAKYYGAGVRSAVKGYHVGGSTGTRTAVIEDLDFATELSAAISATLATATELAQGVSNIA